RCRRVIAWRWRCNFQWRNPYGIPRLKPRFGLGALPIYAHFAFANDALDVAERQAGKPCFVKPVDPHPGFVGADGGGFHLAFASDHARGCGRPCSAARIDGWRFSTRPLAQTRCPARLRSLAPASLTFASVTMAWSGSLAPPTWLAWTGALAAHG